MFMPGSRYEKMPTYSARMADGREVTAVRLPLPRAEPVIGFHQRLESQRLDHLAAVYLADATAFWRLCDANGTIVPAALGARDLIGIPAKG